MPRAVSAEESLVAGKHERLQRSTAFETGLVLASVGAKSDMLLRFAPTPQEEGGFTFQKGAVDAEWMVKHAELVARMLPAGIAVLGCYAFAQGAKLTKMEASLQPVVAFLSKRIAGVGLADGQQQALLLLMPSDAKKVTCRALTVGASKLSPLELKIEKKSPPLVCFSADWKVELELPLAGACNAAGDQSSEIASAVDTAGESLEEAIATVDGTLPTLATPVSSLASPLNGADQPYDVAFYSPSLRGAAPSGGATVRLVGTVHGRCFAGPKEDVEGALAALRVDLLSTLRYRVTKFFDDREDDDDDGALALDAPSAHALPRRAHLELGDGTFSVCDHLDDDDDAAALAERLHDYLGLPEDESPCAELLALAAQDDTDTAAFEELLGPEAMPSELSVAPARAASGTASGTASSKGAAAGKHAADSAAGAGKGASGGMSMAVLVGVVAVLLAAAAALMASGGSGAAAEPPAAALAEAVAAAAGAGEAIPADGTGATP